MTSPAIELHGVAVGYAGTPVLRDVDLQVQRGEAVAVVGANGSGKSTLISALVGLAEVIDGTVDLLGQRSLRRRDRWRVGYVPQATPGADALPLTVRELVATGRLPRLAPWRPMGRADRAAVAEALEVAGLAGFERRRFSQLSGGERRRALIARTLAAEPEVLLLDEPTAGVDAATRAALAVSLRDLHAKGMTIVLVSHEIGPVEALVGRVVALDDGRVAYDGPPRPTDRVGHDGHHHDDGPHVGASLGLLAGPAPAAGT